MGVRRTLRGGPPPPTPRSARACALTEGCPLNTAASADEVQRASLEAVQVLQVRALR